MNQSKKQGIITVLLSFTLAIASPALAQTQLEIDADTSPFQQQKLTADPVSASVSYDPARLTEQIDEHNLRYQIFYLGILVVEDSEFTIYRGSVSLQDLDGNGISEVVVETYSGGAHCCTNFTIYTWEQDQFTKLTTGFLDGTGGEWRDLDGDGTVEFLTSDNTFLYRFSSYAGSFPPSRILKLSNGKWIDVTRQHSPELRSRAWKMYLEFLERQKTDVEVNGILAGYVAQKALLGEYEQGWQFMLAHYDPNSEWGLGIFQEGKKVQQYVDFPAALRAFLREQGYL